MPSSPTPFAFIGEEMGLVSSRGADSHGHRPDHLTACRLGIQDAPCCADSEHAPHTRLARCGINADLDKMRAKCRLHVERVQVAKFDGIFSNETALASQVGQPDN